MRYLILCTGNTCRSPMGEALLRQRGAQVSSAGMAAEEGQPAAANAVAVMREAGMDITAHRARQVTAEMCARADRILVMSPSHAVILQRHFGVLPEKITVLHVPDPYGGDLTAYRAARDAIEAALPEDIL